MEILGIIPARGKSKGIPRKNIYPVKGLPLIAYTVKAAAASRLLTDFIVSSDDQEIIDTAKKFGAEAPFVRPANLAADTASSLDVVRHALQFMEAKKKRPYDAVVLLQPTAPLRTAEDIDRAVELLAQSQSKADSVVSVSRVEDPHPGKMMLIKNGRLHPLLPDWWREGIRRQDLPPVYFLNGAVYCAWRETIVDQNSLWGENAVPYEMPAGRSVVIDASEDLRLLEILLESPHAL